MSKRSGKFNFSILLLALIILSAGPVLSSSNGNFENKEPAQLYRVDLNSQSDADLLTRLNAEPVLRVENGYLVLINGKILDNFLESGLYYKLIADNIIRENLALDISMDGHNSEIYPIIFQDDNIRILAVNPEDLFKDGEVIGLAPLMTSNIKFIYKKPLNLQRDYSKDIIDLDSLVSLTLQDSLISWLEALQSFPPRVTGSQSDYDSRDWIFNKFVELGYDSVILDSFTYSGNNVQNIVAYKIGTTYPEHQIVVGGHKDAVSDSPGADDNGSGTVGVLEMARIMRDIDTKMTYKFICFDGEEQGLHGAWHNADEAAANGDSIVCMLNMDMIGFEGNLNDVTIYHNPDATMAQLWVDLADSLTGINLTGHLSGTITASDHYAYQQNGYDVVFAIEYNFNDWYHTYRDSTSYIDYSYMERIIRGMLAAGYEINNTYVPLPGLTFTYPEGVPEFLTPNIPDTFLVHIEGSSGGVVVPSSGMLYYTIEDQSPQFTIMEDLGGGDYHAILPSTTCEFPNISFYVSAQEETTGTINNPDPSNPFVAYAATDIITAFEDDFESEKGWTVSGGTWARGNPTGGGGQYGNPDPSGAHSGTSEFGYNLNGDYENSMPERHLTSPAIDCSDIQNAELKFWRWLGVEQPLYDHAYLRISTNGTTWTTIWENEETIEDGEWTEYGYDISDIADGQTAVYIRFTMGTSDGSWQYCGWNIDDLAITGFTCEETGMIITTASLPDWTVNNPYSEQLEAINGVGKLGWLDIFGNLSGTGLTLNSAGLISGTPSTPGMISFTAQVTDESKNTAIKLFEFNINPTLEIATLTLPDWTENIPYNQQLNSSGGTGSKIWQDKNNDLAGTGLVLASSGILSGTPTTSGAIVFTAQIIDDIGAIDEQELILNVNSPVMVTTESLPSGIEGDPFSYQLVSTGGTGVISWSDINDNLNGTGLELSSSGLISGILPSAGVLSFTARALDEVGSQNDKALSIEIDESFICGDLNNTETINIIDITYLISYLYKGGPEPIPMESGDVNNTGDINILDITYLISYLYKSGADPECP
ncbi:MAG: M28 family peptidase [Candidatus Zixiibacteriota bacterium]